MTPKEAEAVNQLLEKVGYEFYKLGVEHGQSGDPANVLDEKAFSMSKASKLVLKTNMSKALNKR